MAKGELNQAAKESRRALAGFDAAISTDSFFSRFIETCLGAMYYQQRIYQSAATIYQRVYEAA